ncbi:hypothetical protein HZS_2706 [Henneguya salminicola]|nr:hypothetical protein HZS_2706 [Henneguya salminicola]
MFYDKIRTANITKACLGFDCETFYIGTKRSDVHFYEISKRIFKNFILSEEIVLQNYGIKKYCSKLGCVESLMPNNSENQKIIIGYSYGIILIWDVKSMRISSFMNKNEQLFSVCWGTNESMFVSSHSHGLICCWSCAKTTKDNDILGNYSPVPFYPRDKISCQHIKKIIWRDSFFIFYGGLPDNISCERHILSMMTGGTISQIIEVGSAIIDFIDLPIDLQLHSELKKNSFFLMILTEHELITLLIVPNRIDPNTLTVAPYTINQVLPYHLPPITTSCVTTSCIVSCVSPSFLEDIVESGKRDFLSNFVDIWPLDGGYSYKTNQNKQDKNLIITGHEDGCINFWYITIKKESPMLYRIKTSDLYIQDEYLNNELDDKNQNICSLIPQKYGFYNPYCDDPRHTIQKIYLCEQSFTLIVGGSAGNVLIFKLNQKKNFIQPTPNRIECNLIQKYPSFIWKGHDKLNLKNNLSLSSGYYLDTVLSIHPSSPISSISYCLKWGLLAVGTCYGFLLYDCFSKTIIYCACTYDISGINLYIYEKKGITSGGENIQRNSFLRSLRNSLRIFSKKKKINNPQENHQKSLGKCVKEQEIDFISKESLFNRSGLGSGQFTRIVSQNTELLKTNRESLRFQAIMEMSNRFISGKKIDPTLKGLIRSLCFVECPISSNSSNIKPMLVVGSNCGKIYIIVLKFQIFNDDKNIILKTVDCSKEIQMNHKAPIIGFQMIGKNGEYIDVSCFKTVQNNITLSFNHYLLCCTEEQIKIINLQNFKTKLKTKITVNEGNRLKKSIIINTKYNCFDEFCRYLIAISTTGKLLIYSLHNLKMLNCYNLIPKEDILSITTLCLNNKGFGVYQCTSYQLNTLTIISNKYNQQHSSLIPIPIPI